MFLIFTVFSAGVFSSLSPPPLTRPTSSSIREVSTWHFNMAQRKRLHCRLGGWEDSLLGESVFFSVQEKWRKEGGKPFQPPRLYLPVAKTLTHVILIDSILPFFWHHILPKNRASFIPVKCLNNFKADLMADWELTV